MKSTIKIRLSFRVVICAKNIPQSNIRTCSFSIEHNTGPPTFAQRLFLQAQNKNNHFMVGENHLQWLRWVTSYLIDLSSPVALEIGNFSISCSVSLLYQVASGIHGSMWCVPPNSRSFPTSWATEKKGSSNVWSSHCSRRQAIATED